MKNLISGKKNAWFNGESVDNKDLALEQSYNDLVQTSLINNHIGNGILPDNLEQPVLFDSALASGFLDGKAIDIQNQPSDPNYGNLLEIELTDSLVARNRAIKFFLIGLDFNNNLQFDTFVFRKNEKQTNSKHYTKILKVFFNDFVGDPTQSLNLGGRFVIKEAKNFALARDCIMVSQDIQPNVFFRDFFVASSSTSLNNMLVSALPSYNIDMLEIATGYNQLRSIIENDVSSQIGQKFQATTNNIQKISLLLSVINNANTADLAWTGDLIVSIYQLQSSLDCPLDITPATAIDFDPSNIPLAQLTLNYTSLLASGTQLNETPQPVDFVFSNTNVGTELVIKQGSYYAVTVKRAGSADKCQIQLATGTDRIDNSKITFFNGSIWVDVPDEDLWFQVWTDSAKVTDGQAYDSGHGITAAKTQLNSTTGITEDTIIDNVQFVRNDVYYGVVQAATEQSVSVQDQRTGQSVLSQEQFVPSVSLVTANALLDLQAASNPLVIGSITDKNLKSLTSNSINVVSNFHHYGFVGNQCIVKVIDDPTDARYDLSIINLVTELTGSGGASGVNGLLNGQFFPADAYNDLYYRVADTELISMIYGDLNGDGVVDDSDLLLIQSLLGSNLNSIPTYSDYITLITPFAADTDLTWNLIAEDGTTILQSGTDGYTTPNPQDGSRTVFSTGSGNFGSVSSLDTKKIQISLDSSNPANNGTFTITGLINANNLDIQKKYYTSDTILELLRADINGDMIIDATDLNLITNYVNKVAPFPASSSPANKIGTEFQIIRFTIEKYIDRSDDYIASSPRATTIHLAPDILIDAYENGHSLFGKNLLSNPMEMMITKQIGWFDYLVNAKTNPKLVPASFDYQSGYVKNDCSSTGVADSRFPLDPDFDPGRTDIFMPNNIVINHGGEILRPDGYNMKMDFEVGTVILEIPAISFSTEKSINIFSDFVANFNGSGKTRLGYESMRFSDCGYVPMDALSKGQIRFNVAMRSFSPQLNGTDSDGYMGVIVDGRIGVSIDPVSGILKLNFTNLYEDPVLQTMKTRVQITVFLKKGGFNNDPLVITSTKLQNILGLV